MRRNITQIKKEQKRIVSLVTKKFRKYYLTGGTALSFYFDHRFSEDLDFFSQGYQKEETAKIMEFISERTGFNYKLESEQDTPDLIPMRVYFLEIAKSGVLKIDFVQDFAENINKIKDGLHSIEDIYYRKILAAIGEIPRKDLIGRAIPSGRQSAKDLFDICYLSNHSKSVTDFFLEHFSYDKAERLIAWYKGFNRTDLKLELLDLVPGIDTAKVLKDLDKEILKNLPDRLL